MFCLRRQVLYSAFRTPNPNENREEAVRIRDVARFSGETINVKLHGVSKEWRAIECGGCAGLS
jgi:hypothetical protein